VEFHCRTGRRYRAERRHTSGFSVTWDPIMMFVVTVKYDGVVKSSIYGVVVFFQALGILHF